MYTKLIFILFFFHVLALSTNIQKIKLEKTRSKLFEVFHQLFLQTYDHAKIQNAVKLMRYSKVSHMHFILVQTCVNIFVRTT